METGGKLIEKPIYDPSVRNSQKRRPIPVRSSSTKGNDDQKAANKVKVSAGQIIQSSELEMLTGNCFIKGLTNLLYRYCPQTPKTTTRLSYPRTCLNLRVAPRNHHGFNR